MIIKRIIAQYIGLQNLMLCIINTYNLICQLKTLGKKEWTAAIGNKKSKYTNVSYKFNFEWIKPVIKDNQWIKKSPCTKNEPN